MIKTNKNKKQIKLNLGCGDFPKTGYINVDHRKCVNPDVIHNLNKIPFPFKKDNFDLIEADHVLEHLEHPFDIMKELHRILKPNGILMIKVPHFSRGFTHPEHQCGFDVTFPFYFNPTFKGGYIGTTFQVKKMFLNWFAQPYLKKTVLPKLIFILLKILNIIINFFANISPYFCSRVWCFLVGGFEEIKFEFICIKKGEK